MLHFILGRWFIVSRSCRKIRRDLQEITIFIVGKIILKDVSRRWSMVNLLNLLEKFRLKRKKLISGRGKGTFLEIFKVSSDQI